MKKIVIFSICLLLIISLTACDKKEEIKEESGGTIIIISQENETADKTLKETDFQNYTYGESRTYYINIISPENETTDKALKETVYDPTTEDFHDHTTEEIANALEGTPERGTVTFLMELNKDNLSVISIIPTWRTKPYSGRETSNLIYYVYSFAILNESEGYLFGNDIRELSYYDPSQDEDIRMGDVIYPAKPSFIIKFPYYKNAKFLRLYRILENGHIETVDEIILKN